MYIETFALLARALFWPSQRLNNSFCFETVGYSPGYHWSWHSQNEVSLCQWQQFYPHDLVTKDDDKKVNLDASKLHNDSIFGILEDSTSKMAKWRSWYFRATQHKKAYYVTRGPVKNSTLKSQSIPALPEEVTGAEKSRFVDKNRFKKSL